MSNEPDRHDDLAIPVLGETVAATRFEPLKGTAPRPVVLIYAPYHKDDFMGFGSRYADVQYLTANGYEVVIADMIGSGASTGGGKDMFGPAEGEEAARVVEWLAARPWSNGEVGMIGMSYSGITCLKAAAERPAGLSAIVPSFAPINFESLYEGGTVFLYWLMTWAATMQTWQAMPPTRRDTDSQWNKIWNNRLTDLSHRTPWFIQVLKHDTLDRFWQEREIDPRAIQIPTLAFAGYRDPYHRDTIEYCDKIEAPTRLILGPWRHTRPYLGREIAINERRQTVRWLDKFLKDNDPDELQSDSIAYWTQKWDQGRLEDGHWKYTPSWRKTTGSETKAISYALSQDGLIDQSALADDILADSLEVDHSVGMASTDTHTPHAGELNAPIATNPDDGRSLCFESEPLAAPVITTGTGCVTIQFESSIPDPLLVARLVDVSPRGSARLVATGRLRPQFRNGLSEAEPLVPNDRYDVTIPLSPISHHFEQRHRIRLSLSGALFPLALPVTEHGRLTIYSAPEEKSELVLPREPDSATSAPPFDISKPDEQLPLHSRYVLDDQAEVTTTRNHLSGGATFTVETGRQMTTPYTEQISRSRTATASIVEQDPSELQIDHESTATVHWEDYTAKVVTTAEATLDDAEMTTKVSLEDQTRFESSWSW